MYTTRSGRLVKKPDRYEPPEEELDDDYKDNEYDSESIVNSEEDEESEEDDESDADEKGNLAGFVESDEEESEEDDD